MANIKCKQNANRHAHKIDFYILHTFLSGFGIKTYCKYTVISFLWSFPDKRPVLLHHFTCYPVMKYHESKTVHVNTLFSAGVTTKKGHLPSWYVLNKSMHNYCWHTISSCSKYSHYWVQNKFIVDPFGWSITGRGILRLCITQFILDPKFCKVLDKLHTVW